MSSAKKVATKKRVPGVERRTGQGAASSVDPATTPMAPTGARRSILGPVAVVLSTAALLVPFLNKAYHVDDTVFLRVAREIEHHPLYPYNFDYNWLSWPCSMWKITQHPPFHSYLLAVVGLVAGYSEPAMHAYIMLIAAGCALTMYLLARRFSRWPALATILSVLTPAFLVSAGTLMADVPLLFFWLLATCFAVESAESGRGWMLWPAGVAAAAAAMTKYFGVAVAPALFVYWIARQRRVSPHLLALALPVIVLTLWGWYSKVQADVIHPLGAANYALERKTPIEFIKNAAVACSFLGGTLLWPVFLMPAGLRLPKWIGAIVAVLWTAIAVYAFNKYAFETALLFSVLALSGLFVLASAIASCRARPDADTVLLGLWFFGTMAFAAFVNWTVNARVVLPAVFPATLLTLRWIESLETRTFWHRWILAAACPTLAISMLIALSDARFAEASRQFSQTVGRRLVRSGHPVYFFGHWGFQYYMEQENAKALDLSLVESGHSPLQPNDLVVLPDAACNSNAIPNGKVVIPRVLLGGQTYSNPYGFVTMNAFRFAGFYSMEWGMLPFTFAKNPIINQFQVWQVVPDRATTDVPPSSAGVAPSEPLSPPATRSRTGNATP